MGIRRAVAGDEKGMAEVHVSSWKTTYNGLVADDFLDSLKVEERELTWKKGIIHTQAFVAEDDRRIVGFANGGHERSGSYPGYDGELYAIYLLKECQGKGTGQKLVRYVAGALKEAGFRSLVIRVLEENPSRGFYEALGGIPVGAENIDIGGECYAEVVYGWPDLDVLLQ